MFNEHVETILEKRYLLPGETPEEMFRRVAHAVAMADGLYGADGTEIQQSAERFYNMMASLDFLPNSPTLMNAGTELGQLAACFVLPVDDSIEGIFNAVKYAAIIQKSGGGTGFSFSRLRPEGDPVRSTAGVASGPVSFMHVFDTATHAIKQGGRRRGANMAVLRVDHPDIEKFITVKNEAGELSTFNLSVAATDAFMEAVINDESYDLVNPRIGKAVKQESAVRIFRLIAESAWKSGEPGLVFIDRINRDNPTPGIGVIEATNPCGEQPLLAYEACNLGSINLRNMVEGGQIRRLHLAKVVRNAVRFLDNVIDVNRYPLPEIRSATLANRKIGLGVMGFADLLIELGIPYDSDEAVKTAKSIMKMVSSLAKDASLELARKRGPFPNFSESNHARQDARCAGRLRNATTTTIAPTGTISLIAACSSGIEPLYAVSYSRKALDGKQFHFVDPAFIRIARKREFLTNELLEEISRETSIQHIDTIPEDVRRLFRTAHDIDPKWHIRIQAAFQEHTDNAVSKTVNLPASATVDDVEKAYLMAYELGCKGITVYRDHSRNDQVLVRVSEVRSRMSGVGFPISDLRPSISVNLTAGGSPTGSDNAYRIPGVRDADKSESLQARTPRERPATTFGTTTRITTGCGKLYVTVNHDEHGPCEVFAQMGKSGGCAASQTEAVCRLISLALRSGIRPQAVVKQLAGIRCPLPVWHDGRQILSCADAISVALCPSTRLPAGSRRWQAGPTRTDAGAEPPPNPGDHEQAEEVPGCDSGATCPECGNEMSASEGCLTCLACGFSRCS